MKQQEKIGAIFSGACARNQICPVKDIMASYGDKWTLYAVLFLGQHGTLRFQQLLTGISGISQRMLTVTLRSLERDGIITRATYAEMPPRVEYELTSLGESLLRHLLQLATWADAHFGEVLEARATFDAQRKSE